MHSVGTGILWTSFFIFVITIFSFDLVVLGGGKSHRVSTKEALRWTIVWILCAILFNVALGFYLKATQGPAIAYQKSLEFFTGYLIEESLSIDNMFVILMIFKFFTIPAEYQRRVLMFGVMGAIVMRLAVILSGTWLVREFHWVLYLFGAFILITGFKMLFLSDKPKDLSENILVVWLQKHLRVTHHLHKEHFFIRQNRYWYATPLFLALVLVEVSDLIFALDSIPAIFAITTDAFIVFTSNIFAILGLRSLYFLLANMSERFHLLKYGIALVLIFVGVKMLLGHWFELPILLTLSIVVSILATSVILSILREQKQFK